MSYILNALRKSEQERQAIEPDNVTSRIVVQQAQQQKTSRGLLATLIVINLGVLVYFLLLAPYRQQLTEPPANTLHSLEAAKAAIPSTKIESTPAPKPAIAKTIENTRLTSPLPVADSSPLSKKATVKAKLVITQPPAIASPKPVSVKADEVSVASEDAIPTPAPTLPPIIQPSELPRQTVEKPAPAIPKNDLPFLQDLPSEVSRSVPVLAINVFSYSNIASERFVMIDMVKYVPGQSIKEGLLLKEIREDSIVVSNGHYTFKIRRP